MKKIDSSICLLLILLSSFINAQSVLGYKDFLLKVETNHPLAKRYANVAESGLLKYKAARGGYDPYISTDYENKFYDSKNYYAVLHSEIKQPLFTSQYIKAGYDYGQGNFINPESITKYNGVPFIGLEASLLQGMMIDKRRAEVLKAKHYRTYAEADRQALLNELYFIASYSYVDWALSCKEMNLYSYFVELARLRFEGIKILSEIAEKAPIDSVEAGLLYNTRLMEMQLVSIDNKKKEADILSMYRTDNSSAQTIDLNYTSDSIEYFFDLSKKLVMQFANDSNVQNPIIKKYEAYGRVLNVERRYKAELIKPKVDVKYNFLLNTNNNQLALINSNSYKWGASVAFPLFLRSARNDYKMAQLDVKNNELELDNKRYELDLKLNVIKQNINTLLGQMTLAERNVRYSKQMVEAEKLKFDNGESTLFLINTRESKWLETELKLAEIRAKFIKMSLEYTYLKGNLNYEW